MKSRLTVLLILVVALVTLLARFGDDRNNQSHPGRRSVTGSGRYTGAPTAAEEGDEEPVVSSTPSKKPHTSATDAGRLTPRKQPSPHHEGARSRTSSPPVLRPATPAPSSAVPPIQPGETQKTALPESQSGARGGKAPESAPSSPVAEDQARVSAVSPEVSQAPPRSVEGEPALNPPVLLSQPPLAYPTDGYRITVERAALTPELRIVAAEGRVVLRILVLVDGSVARVEVAVSSGSSVLDETAVAAARNWKFAPATRDGQPIESWVMIPVRFVVP